MTFPKLTRTTSFREIKPDLRCYETFDPAAPTKPRGPTQEQIRSLIEIAQKDWAEQNERDKLIKTERLTLLAEAAAQSPIAIVAEARMPRKQNLG